MKLQLVVFSFVSLIATALDSKAQSQVPIDEGKSEPAVCLAKRTDPVFQEFSTKKDEWNARHKNRKAEFHPKLMSHADELGKCVERALRRDLSASSTTTFGVAIDGEGRINKVAMLESSHENNLYGNCLVRTVCKVQLSPSPTASPEVFTFDFDVRRKKGTRLRTWSLDPRM